MMRAVLFLVYLAVTLVPVLAAAQVDSAATQEFFTVEVDFYADGEPVQTEILIGNRKGGSVSAKHESLNRTTSRPTMVIWATFHDPLNVPPAPRVAQLSPVWTEARRKAQRFTCNDVDLAVFNPAADACRVTVFWGDYEMLRGGALGGLRSVTRAPRSTCIQLYTPATAFYDATDDIARLMENSNDQFHARALDPATPRSGDIRERPAEPALPPLDSFQVMPDASILGATPDGPIPLEHFNTPPLDTRPLAIYDNRIVRYDASVLTNRTIYYVNMEFFNGGHSRNLITFSVLDIPMLPLYSSLYQPLAVLMPAPDPAVAPPRAPATTVELNYLVQVFSSDGQTELRGIAKPVDLQQPFAGQPNVTLPTELAAAMQQVTAGGLNFAFYYPGVDSVSIQIQAQSIPAHFLVKEKGELLPVLINRLPGEIINLGEYRAGLSTAAIGPVVLPAGCRQVSDLGIVTSSRQLLEVDRPR